jgi:hypothetical protein
MRITNTIKFNLKASIIHENKYDYSLVNYTNSGIVVDIICPIHGIFKQRPRNHLKGQGCPYCNGTFRKTNDEFISEAIKVHGNKYDYSLIEYSNNKKNINIICPIHGIFSQRPQDHLYGRGCRICGGKDKKDFNVFINESNEIHNNFYNYDKTIYKNNWTNIIVTCYIHGDFEVTPNNHLSKKSGCPKCKESLGEKNIRLYLENRNFKYITEKRFKDCRYKQPLPFDFYLSDYNILIEYDGLQHFESIDFFGGEQRLNEQKIKDNIKTEYCNNNNIQLIRIKHTDNINEILDNIKF